MFDYFFYLCREHNNTTNKEIARIESRVFFFSLWERKRLFLLQKLHIKKKPSEIGGKRERESVKIVEREIYREEVRQGRRSRRHSKVYTEENTRGTMEIMSQKEEQERNGSDIIGVHQGTEYSQGEREREKHRPGDNPCASYKALETKMKQMRKKQSRLLLL